MNGYNALLLWKGEHWFRSLVCGSAEQRATVSATNSRLADPWVSREQHHLPLAPLPCGTLVLQKEVKFCLPANKVRRSCWAHQLEVALSTRYAFYFPGGYRLGNSLHLVLADITQIEHIAEQATSKVRDEHHSWHHVNGLLG